MLYIISTPIGNLEDITLRAIETLKRCDYILCEDTRHSLKLLNHYDIKKSLISFHQFNERAREERIIEDLKSGKEIALISDAGTPLISDPGFTLIREIQREGLKVTAIPGPSAVITALTLSGFEPTPFQFVGFLPKKEGELAELVEEMLAYSGTSVAFDTEQHIEKTVAAICEIDSARTIAIARELTKHFEELLTGRAEEIAAKIKSGAPRGELVLLIQGQKSEKTVPFSKEFLQAGVKDFEKVHGLTTKEAIAQLAKTLKVPKRNIYAAVHT